MKRQFRWGGFCVTVNNDGNGCPPWQRPETSSVYRYAVTVSHGGVRYRCKAYGSINDTHRGDSERHQEMGAMVLDELASAYCDPDEFWSLAIGNERPSRQRVKEVERVLDAAQRFGEPLLAVCEILREKDLV